MSFKETLTAMGCGSYQDYLESDHWRSVKSRFRKSGMCKTCAVCGSKRVSLHHKTYKRLGEEYLDDLVPLCQTHHEAVHAWLKEHRMTCEKGTILAIRELRGKPRTPQKKNSAKQQRAAVRKVGIQNKKQKELTEREKAVMNIMRMWSFSTDNVFWLGIPLNQLNQMCAGALKVIERKAEQMLRDLIPS